MEGHDEQVDEVEALAEGARAHGDVEADAGLGEGGEDEGGSEARIGRFGLALDRARATRSTWCRSEP